MNKSRALDFYSYDCINNPWLGGGGSVRDIEMLSRYTETFSTVRLYAGHYPGAIKQKIRGIELVPLGFGNNEVISRISFVIYANLHILFSKNDVIGLNLSLYAPLLTAFLFKRKLYVIIHHFIGKNWVQKTGMIGWPLYGLELWLCKLSNNIVVINKKVEALFINSPKKNILLSGNGYSDKLLNVVDKTDLKNPYLLYLGRIDWFMKGLDLLLDAFVEISKSNPAVRLILAGKTDSNTEDQLHKLIQERNLQNLATLKKNISEAEKFDLLSRCLFFVSPSRYEGWGIAALEANAAGKVVVVSKADGFQQSIRDGYSGLSVDVNDPVQLVKAIQSLLSDSDLRNKMNVDAREWARNFSWDNIAAKELAWIQKSCIKRKVDRL